jgi:hypothetical protein
VAEERGELCLPLGRSSKISDGSVATLAAKWQALDAHAQATGEL